MGFAVGELLRRLCVEIGWSYAVFWRAVGLQEQRYLIWEDAYCGRMHGGISGFEVMDLLIKESSAEVGRPTEDRIFTLVHKRMASQVHIVGDGVVGKAASTGNHQWILQGNFNQNYSATKDLVEINQQLLAGIQTIAVIPVLPQGVLQLGSTQLRIEENGFVNYVQHIFMQSGSMKGTHLCDDSGTTSDHKTQLSASMQPSNSQFGDCSSNVNGLPSHSFDRRGQVFRGHDSKFITKTSSVPTSSLSKVPFTSQQISLDCNVGLKRMMPFSNFAQPTCHVVDPNLCPNNQLKTECLEHSAAFSASNLRIIEKALPHQSGYENYCQPVDVNRSLFPCHLNSLENQFRMYHGTAHGSSGNHEALVDSSKLLHMRTLESKISNSLECSESASSFGISGSSNKAEIIGNSHSLSSDMMESIKRQISSNTEMSQIQSLTYDLDRVHMLSYGFGQPQSTSTGNASAVSSLDKAKGGNRTYQAVDGPMTETEGCGSGDRLHHSFNQNGLYDSCLVSTNKQDPNGTGLVANGQNGGVAHNSEVLPSSSITTTSDPQQQNSESILFDLFDLDRTTNANYRLLDDSFVNSSSAEVCELSTEVPTCIRQIDGDSFCDILTDEISCSGGLFCESGSDQLLDAIVSQMKPTRKLISDDKVFCNAASTMASNFSLHNSSAQCKVAALSEHLPGKFVGQSPISPRSQIGGSNSFKSECSIDRSEGVCSLGDEKSISQISLWVGKARNISCDVMSAASCKRVDEAGKMNRKRSRTGENPRPRPKDRQMIQDRVKELREIVPNGAKLSIDALLEKTIKHMLFLQSVTKHADKLKETGKPKIISEDEGLLLKENFDGGATWAFEVGSQSVICPIMVEDLSTPRHMLVEMLCEKRGLFLEIADLIRGLGLTILKGVMEARNDKVWARFAVEANKDVTRMDIFLSLVQLLEPAVGNAVLEGIRNCKKPQNFLNQSSIPVTGSANGL